ncbi:MAG: gamma-glutamyltransferase [Deltaproteobacteria bacterium]|nr:gamma-glutamyltransferase [Deltaproteobacteria bacterium]
MIFLQFLIQRESIVRVRRVRSARVVLAALCVAAAPSPGLADAAATASPSFLHLGHGAVASDSRIASQVGAEVLEAGGNAVDAACATALALGVVHPFASGLGGGGFALVHLAGRGQTTALDFRETAPRKLVQAIEEGHGIPAQSGLSVGVPGEPAGLAEMVRRFGALPFARCVEPALRLARGFPASPFLIKQMAGEMERNPATGSELLEKLFDLRGRALGDLRVGDRLARPELLATLERLQAGGAKAFYRGRTARALVAAVAAKGGVLARKDLARYAPVMRKPLATKFLGRRILLMPPPSAGGVIIAQALGIVAEQATPNKAHAGLPPADYLHLLAEALKHGFADRSRYLGDPGFVAVPLDRLLDPAYHRELSGRFRPDSLLPHEAYGTPLPRRTAPARDAGTAHVSVVDRAGNAVALTTTINLEFGSRIVAGDTGILLNDELDDFAQAPGRPDLFALAGGAANRPAPGKRPLSSMSPTIVLGENGVELVAGAAGGPRIISATLQLLLDSLLLGRTAQEAMAAPRVHHQWEPDVLYHEPDLPAALVRALRAKGHHTEPRADIAKANMIVRTKSGLDAAADPRSGGAPAGQ